MSDDRLHDFDSTSAIFAAAGSFFWRNVAFFGSACAGHYVGINAGTAGAFFRGLWQLGIKAILDQEQLNPLVIPMSWVGTLLSGCTNVIGLLYLAAVGIAFVMLWLSEDRAPYAIALMLVAQPVHSLLVDEGPTNSLDWAVAAIIVVTWEIGVGAVYWWRFYRESD
jgi:hypothetical protein